MKEYVVGFAFGRVPNLFSTHVLLIQKNRPKAQAGLLNGIGGKFENVDYRPTISDLATSVPYNAMRREFAEETGVETNLSDWAHFATTYYPRRYRIYYFYNEVVNLSAAKAQTDERLVTVPILEVGRGARTLPDLKWLVELALHHQKQQLGLPFQITLPPEFP